MMKIEFKKARCRIEYDFFLKGSVLKGTVESGCNGFRSFLFIDSDAPKDQLIKLAKSARGVVSPNGPSATQSRLKMYSKLTARPWRFRAAVRFVLPPPLLSRRERRFIT
jgi:hypothetical protein